MWLNGSFQSWSKLETLACLFRRIGAWFLLPAKEREEESGPEITLGLHKERKHSLLMATGDCSPSLLSSNTLMSISVFEPPDAQKEKKNSPWASHRKWNAGNTVSKYSLGLTVSPFYCSGCNHSSGGWSFPHVQEHGRLAALPGNAGRWFSPMPFRTSLCWQELREQKEEELFQISFSTSGEWK